MQTSVKGTRRSLMIPYFLFLYFFSKFVLMILIMFSIIIIISPSKKWKRVSYEGKDHKETVGFLNLEELVKDW